MAGVYSGPGRCWVVIFILSREGGGGHLASTPRGQDTEQQTRWEMGRALAGAGADTLSVETQASGHPGIPASRTYTHIAAPHSWSRNNRVEHNSDKCLLRGARGRVVDDKTRSWILLDLTMYLSMYSYSIPDPWLEVDNEDKYWDGAARCEGGWDWRLIFKWDWGGDPAPDTEGGSGVGSNDFLRFYNNN